jgi:hypothetical protein
VSGCREPYDGPESARRLAQHQEWRVHARKEGLRSATLRLPRRDEHLRGLCSTSAQRSAILAFRRARLGASVWLPSTGMQRGITSLRLCVVPPVVPPMAAGSYHRRHTSTEQWSGAQRWNWARTALGSTPGVDVSRQEGGTAIGHTQASAAGRERAGSLLSFGPKQGHTGVQAYAPWCLCLASRGRYAAWCRVSLTMRLST